MDAALIRAFDETWPAAEYAQAGGFRVGRGAGAGGRVSSAVAVGPWTPEDIAAAERIHQGWDQQPLFRVADDDAALAEALAAAGYRPRTPTAIMAAPVATLTGEPLLPLATFAVWPPLAIQRDIWAAGAIDPARLAVMTRVAGPRTSILGRIMDDRAAGAGFAALSGDVVMVHAVEVLPAYRRRGLGGIIMRRAAFWAAEQGASRVGLAVGRDNVAARAAYDRLGFAEVAGYVYYARAS